MKQSESIHAAKICIMRVLETKGDDEEDDLGGMTITELGSIGLLDVMWGTDLDVRCPVKSPASKSRNFGSIPRSQSAMCMRQVDATASWRARHFIVGGMVFVVDM